MRNPIPLVALMLLAACDGAPDNVAAPVPQEPSAFQNAVAALSPPERNMVFIRAIRDANKNCQGVTESTRQGEAATGEPLWVARCTDGATYAVVLGRDGTAQVTGAK